MGDEEEPDPDWIEFDPENNESERKRFFGHELKDEAKLRENV
jgi:hypothetical protein